MIRKLLSTVLLLTVVTLSFTACTGKKEPVISQSAVVSTSETSVSVSTETSVSVSSEASVSQETSVSEPVSPTEEDKHPIEVLVVNQCNADIGTVAIIDPVEGTQENVGALKDGTVNFLKTKRMVEIVPAAAPAE